MDADSSYGGSDTAQDSHSAHELSSTLDQSHMDPPHAADDKITTAVHIIPVPGGEETDNHYYHKNEITLPVNIDQPDFQKSANADAKLPHYMATANLNINESLEHHSNLEEMSRNYRSTTKLNESPESERKFISGGIENPAFVDEGVTNSIKSTFNKEMPYNGELNNSLDVSSLNKNEEPLTEAVNLELINLKPVTHKNGGEPYDIGNGMTTIPLKRDNDRDVGNPYDEYFVPVNEHRKYMRGEKLYVTKDNRVEKSKSKCICWTLCLCLVAAAVIIGILAAVGVIGNQGPLPQEVSARTFDSNQTPISKGSLSFPGMQESELPPSPEPPISTLSPMLPTTDTSKIEVPRALESEMKIDNIQFTPELANKNSSEYKALAESLEDQIKNSLFTRDVLQYGPADIEVKIMEFTPGSVVVKYRIAWKFKEGIHNPKDPIDPPTLKRKLTDTLQRSNGLMDTFHVQETSLWSQKIIDSCQIQNNGCEHLCVFDYTLLDFICLCPQGKHLAGDGKVCDIDSVHFEEDVKDQPQSGSDTSDTHLFNEEPTDHDFVNYNNHNEQMEPELHQEVHTEVYHQPSEESESRHNFNNDYENEFQGEVEPDTEITPSQHKEEEPEYRHHLENEYEHEFLAEVDIGTESQRPIEPESFPEPPATAEPPAVEHTVKSESTSTQTEPSSLSVPEIRLIHSIESSAEPEPPVEPEPSAEPKPSAELEIPVEPEPSAEPEPSVESEPSAEPEPSSETEASTESESSAEPEPIVEFGPAAEPESSAQFEFLASSKPSAEYEPSTEPAIDYELTKTPERSSEPKSSSEPESVAKLESSTEIAAEPEPTKPPELSVEPNPLTGSEPSSEPEPTFESEPSAEPDPSGETEPSAEPQPSNDSKTGFTVEPKPESEENILFHISDKTESFTETHMKENTENQMSIDHTTQPAEHSSEVMSYVNDLLLEDKSMETVMEKHNSSELLNHVNDLLMAGHPAESDTEKRINHLEDKESSTEVHMNINNIVQHSTQQNMIHNETTGNVIEIEQHKHFIEPVEINQNDFYYDQSLKSPEEKKETNNTNFVREEPYLFQQHIPVIETSSSINEVTNTSELPEIKTEFSTGNTSHEEKTADSNEDRSTEYIMDLQPGEMDKEMQRLGLLKIVTPIAEVITMKPLVTEGPPEIATMEFSTMKTLLNDVTTITNTHENKVQTEYQIPIIIAGTSDDADTQSTKNDVKENQINISEIHRVPKIQELHMYQENYHEQFPPSNHTMDTMDHPDHLHDEYMSPFLPELENDTFINSLHTDEHFLDHHMPENHENMSVTKPPTLEFDQLNRTNPFDNNTSDASTVALTEEKSNINVDTTKEQLMTVVPNEEKTTKIFEDDTTVKQEEPDTITSMLTEKTEAEMEPLKSNEAIGVMVGEKETQMNITDTNDSELKTKYETSMNSITETNTTVKNELEIKLVDTTESEIDTTMRIETQINMTKKSESEPYTANETATDLEMTTRGDLEIITTDTNRSEPKTTDKAEAEMETTIQNENEMNIRDENEMEIKSDEVNLETNNIVTEIETATQNEKIIDDEVMVTTDENNSRMETTNVPQDEKIMEIESADENRTEMKTETSDVGKISNDEFISKSLEDTSTTLLMEMSTLPPEIFNNIHSNNIFEKFSHIVDRHDTETEKQMEMDQHVQNFYDVSTSTEDLIALETTVNVLKTLGDRATNMSAESNLITTVNAEIIETVTTAVNVNIDEEDANEISTKFNKEITADQKEYRVKETFADLTTTEKLFVTPKTTTEHNTEEDEDLSVVPLNEVSTDESRKLNKKEVSVDSRDARNEIAGERSTEIEDNNISTFDSTQKKFLDNKSSKPVTEDFDLPKFTRCPVAQFQCINGTAVKDGSYCIADSDRCDSVLDCTDGSDEVRCEEEGCPNNFQCNSGQCLKRHLVCDGILNCNDGSDENNCENWTCNFDELSCGPSNRCIPISWKCDGRSHCNDGSDEHNCHPGECSGDAFRCSEQGSCVPATWTCDGKPDCASGEDEKMCDCSNDQFKCQLGGGCIPKTNRCDGFKDCADNSDEWNCLRLETLENSLEGNTKKILQFQAENNTWYPVCIDWGIWNSTFADVTCRNLGYSGSVSLEAVPKPDSFKLEQVYKLKTPTSNVLTLQLEKTSDDCDQFVSLICQEYVCGSPSALEVPSARIVGGSKAAPTQWPSLTLLYNQKRNTYCTSTLVTPLWAIASYSCVVANSQAVDHNDWIIYAGGVNKAHNSSSQIRKVQQIVEHPQAKFSHFEFVNDVVLLRLEKTLQINQNVSALCLPGKEIQPRQLCIVAGWGVSKPGEPTMQQYLHYLPVPMIETVDCNSTKHYNGKMNSDKICAGYMDSEKTPCYNDEGAPLMCFSDTTALWELHGLLSHHDNCGSNKHPAVYTTVNSNLRLWIANTIGRQALNVP